MRACTMVPTNPCALRMAPQSSQRSVPAAVVQHLAQAGQGSLGEGWEGVVRAAGWEVKDWRWAAKG
jgi:hypothetical protein